MNQCNEPNLEQPPGGKKRGRPSAKNDAARVWEDNETTFLIEMWAQNENLYNTKHRNYFNRDIRQKTLTLLEQNLNEHGISASSKQIAKKLTDLKNYYGAQRRMIESSKASGAGASDVYVSPWKFFDQLHFLNDAFTPRRTQSNAEETAEPGPYETGNPPSAKSARKIAESQADGFQKIMASAATALQQIASRKPTQQQSGSEDDAFCSLLKAQLAQIPDCNAKDDLKIDIQQKVLQCKRHIQASVQNNLFNAAAGVQPHSSTPFGSPQSSYSSNSSGY